MQRCKYLDDLGIPINEYGTNFMSDDDSRQKSWTKEREKYGFDNRETWNLDRMMYKEYTIVNTSFHKIPYKDAEITQGQAIGMVLSLAKQCLLNSNDDKLFYDNLREICDLWKEVLPYMWW